MGGTTAPGDFSANLVAGSNDNGVVRSVTRTVSAPDNFNWHDAVENTDTRPDITYNEAFQHFPTGDGGGGGQGSDDEVRNPLNVCQTLLTVCP